MLVLGWTLAYFYKYLYKYVTISWLGLAGDVSVSWDSVNKDCVVVKLTVIFQQEGLYGRMAIEEGEGNFYDREIKCSMLRQNDIRFIHR